MHERWPRSLGGSTNIAGAEKQRPSSVLYRKKNLLIKEEELNFSDRHCVVKYEFESKD